MQYINPQHDARGAALYVPMLRQATLDKFSSGLAEFHILRLIYFKSEGPN